MGYIVLIVLARSGENPKQMFLIRERVAISLFFCKLTQKNLGSEREREKRNKFQRESTIRHFHSLHRKSSAFVPDTSLRTITSVNLEYGVFIVTQEMENGCKGETRAKKNTSPYARTE